MDVWAAKFPRESILATVGGEGARQKYVKHHFKPASINQNNMK